MYLIFSLASVLSTSLGTFLTRSLITKLPAFQIIGPLFFLNSVGAIPIALVAQNWVVPDLKQIFGLVAAGILTAIGAILLFRIVERAPASTSIVGASLSPAIVLLLAPGFLNQSFSFSRFLLVAALIFATLFPIRKSVLGISSVSTVIMMLAQGVNAGVLAILITSLSRSGLVISEVLLVQQVVAGLVCVALFPIKDVPLSSLPILAHRALYMSMGWIFYTIALKRGETLVVQSVLSLIPMSILLMETIRYKRKPPKEAVLSAALVIVCISSLVLV
ncbi:MAG: EamA family transporter [Actinobacteria bacterium]|nr:EamA family transporter [Actinomycetota bacterium]